MKRNFRRVLALGLTALLFLALTACGSSSGDEENAASNEAASSSGSGIEESLSYLQEQYPDLNIVDGERM